MESCFITILSGDVSFYTHFFLRQAAFINNFVAHVAQDNLYCTFSFVFGSMQENL